jgi:hypothetical protein
MPIAAPIVSADIALPLQRDPGLNLWPPIYLRDIFLLVPFLLPTVPDAPTAAFTLYEQLLDMTTWATASFPGREVALVRAAAGRHASRVGIPPTFSGGCRIHAFSTDAAVRNDSGRCRALSVIGWGLI